MLPVLCACALLYRVPCTVLCSLFSGCPHSPAHSLGWSVFRSNFAGCASVRRRQWPLVHGDVGKDGEERQRNLFGDRCVCAIACLPYSCMALLLWTWFRRLLCLEHAVCLPLSTCDWLTRVLFCSALLSPAAKKLPKNESRGGGAGSFNVAPDGGEKKKGGCC